MRRTAKMLPLTVAGFLFFLCIFSAPGGRAEEQATVKPLFPVRLDHEFPNSKKTFEEVKSLILKNYYSDDISEEALYWAAIEGMLRQISPPKEPDLAKIWTAEAYEKIFLALQNNLISIGLKSSYNPNEGSLTITEVLPNSPAESILKPYDRILRINSQPLKAKTLQELNALLDGEAGTEVSLTVNRDINVFDVTLKRRKFSMETLIVSPLTDKIALVEIKRFTADVSKKLKDELSKLKENGFQKLIIDLRNNPGGIFAESLRVVELFLPEKSILLRTFQREQKLQNYVSVNTEPFAFEMAILVNHNTASSAEVLASSLQDHQRALIIGTRTFGKGVFENTFKLDNDFRVKFITGAMYSPKGQSWHGNGVTPDFLVEQDDKTLEALLKIEVGERFRKDVAMITAYKLLMR
uniref:PDZ domain-containing protein n=1 Tax=Candidatus Desulfatibia profunda TaxID=2841695 RepID=A0A8J6TI92_9BACT|nr:PDZ domain-containing protein [Candidatus Desulfatibia profunda]